MINEKVLAVVTGVSAVAKKKKLEDGTKVKEVFHKVKIETSDIDYSVIQKFNPSISSTLLNIQPMPFKFISFGDQGEFNLKLETDYEDNVKIDGVEDGSIDLTKVNIFDLSVVNKENIPTYVFTLLIPADKNINGKYLSGYLKQKVFFTISE